MILERLIMPTANNESAQTISASPVMPRPLALPLRLLPTPAHSKVLALALNRLFAPELADGELDFLEARSMLIDVQDANLQFRLTLNDGRLQPAATKQAEDLSIAGTVYDFLLLATRREDPDTLFFNRRLRLGGDTELGLYAKNFLDAMEIEARIGPLLQVLQGTTSLIDQVERLRGRPIP